MHFLIFDELQDTQHKILITNNDIITFLRYYHTKDFRQTLSEYKTSEHTTKSIAITHYWNFDFEFEPKKGKFFKNLFIFYSFQLEMKKEPGVCRIFFIFNLPKFFQ